MCRIEIILPDGTCVRVDDQVGVAALRQVMAVLRGCFRWPPGAGVAGVWPYRYAPLCSGPDYAESIAQTGSFAGFITESAPHNIALFGCEHCDQLIWRPEFAWPDAERRQGIDHVEATLESDGAFICGSFSSSSPSVAAGHGITAKNGRKSLGRNYWSINGWLFWKVAGRNGEVKTLDALRRELLSA